MKSRLAIALAAGIFALTAVAGPALAAEKKAEKKEEKKKADAPDTRIVDYKASVGTKFETGAIDNFIFEPGFQISHKNSKKASGNLVFKTNVTEYSKTDQKDKLNVSLEWKKKEAFGKFSLKFNHDNYSKNKAKTSSDFTFMLEKKHSDRHATEFTLGFSPDFYGGVGKTEEEADDVDDDATAQCYDYFENEIAVDDAGTRFASAATGTTAWTAAGRGGKLTTSRNTKDL